MDVLEVDLNKMAIKRDDCTTCAAHRDCDVGLMLVAHLMDESHGHPKKALALLTLIQDQIEEERLVKYARRILTLAISKQAEPKQSWWERLVERYYGHRNQ